MDTNNTKRFGRAAAAVIAAGMLSVLTIAMPAAAAIDPYTIDPGRTGSITLTKYSTPANEVSAIQGTGKQDPAAPTPNSVPLAGASFQVYKVNKTGLDLTTSAGWSALESLISTTGPNPSQAALTGVGGVSLAAQGEKTTDASGTLKWSNLPLGLYYVTETAVPAGHKASAPFFVTLPMTDPVNRDAWMYDVFVYPKNAQDSTTKIPLDTDVKVPGDPLAWEISTVIPSSTVTIMRFEDVLDPALDYKSVEAQIGTPWGAASATTLTAGDFTSTYNAATRQVTVALTAAGLAKVNANQGKTLLVHINTVVNSNYAGIVNNAATVITNKPGSNTDTEQVVTPGSQSKYGKITVNKTDTAGTPLSGAQFKVYYSHVASPNFGDKTQPTSGIADTGVVCDMTAAGVTSCTDEVRFSDFAENTQLAAGDARWNYYWLVETKSPTGYELLTTPIAFQVTKDNTDAAFTLPTITVENVKRGGGLVLPFTGGAGSIAFVSVGLALLAGGVVLMVVRARRKAAAEAEISA